MKEPKIAFVRHTTSEPGFVPQCIELSHKFSGMYSIASYLIQKAEPSLAELGEKQLKYLVTTLLFETYAREKTVGGSMQILVIPKDRDAYEIEDSELVEITNYVGENRKELDGKFIEILKHSEQDSRLP